jgi:hypothetical protein
MRFPDRVHACQNGFVHGGGFGCRIHPTEFDRRRAGAAPV